jgi:voltage-gated potassium channel
MIRVVIIGIVGITVTVALHAMATSFIVSLLQKHAFVTHQRFGRGVRPVILGLAAGALAVKHFADIVLWAIAYRNFAGVDQFEDFETAVYFSSVTYTTLGYGDIVLTSGWRIICGIEAMNGIMLFGWSAALLFVVVQRMWFVDDVSASNKTNNQNEPGQG